MKTSRAVAQAAARFASAGEFSANGHCITGASGWLSKTFRVARLDDATLTRLGSDRDYQWRVGSDVVFWLPRLIHFVVLGGMPVKDFLYAADCAPVRT